MCWLVGWLVGFNGISTSIGYLMPKPVYTYYMYVIHMYSGKKKKKKVFHPLYKNRNSL